MGVGPHSQLLHSQSAESTASADCPLPSEGDSAGICPPSSSQRQTETEGDYEKVEEREEGRRPPKPLAKDPPKLLPDPFPVAEFGSHVERNHTNNNQPFVTEFEVDTAQNAHIRHMCTIIMVLCVMQALGDGQGKSITVARSVENRKKNRFANISACESFTINKSHPVCVMVCR